MTRGDSSRTDPSQAAGLRFAAVFAEPLNALFELRPFPIVADNAMDPPLRRELERWKQRFPVDLPIGALLVFLTGWIRIYGTVCMEVFGHLRFALADGEPMFEHEILGLAEILGRPRTTNVSKSSRTRGRR